LGAAIERILVQLGITDVIWIPDSELGTWDSALAGSGTLRLIRVSREGEAIGVAAGLLLGGRRPVVVMQCTGFFEAGDAFRNVVHDLRLPLFLILGIRSYQAHIQGKTKDSCPVFTLPILQAWQVPYRLLQDAESEPEWFTACKGILESGRAGVVCVGEP
jgi:sulfopyruvate decarboxylase TPP-binding subunit